jgi:hypothetical protein
MSKSASAQSNVIESPADNVIESPASIEDVSQLQLQLLMLKRLARLNETRETRDPIKHPRARLMIDKAIYSTYWDCVALGRRNDARMILGLNDTEFVGEPLAA